jgi:cation transport protein ChaC
MWIFGYGSLMWDGWEKSFDCIKSNKANLINYRRVLNKKSVVNWGTSDHPCPTLNVIPEEDSVCTGVAFEFSNEKSEDIISYLNEREGENFELTEIEISINDTSVNAITPIYKGNNLIIGKSIQELAPYIHKANGTDGKCIDYLRNLINKMEELDIEDETISSIWDEVQLAN